MKIQKHNVCEFNLLIEDIIMRKGYHTLPIMIKKNSYCRDDDINM